MRNTRSSRAISSDMAWVMASMYVVSAIPVTILDVQPASRVGRIRHRRALGLVGRGVDLLTHALLNLREVVLRRDAELHQHLLIARDRILRLPLFDQLR